METYRRIDKSILGVYMEGKYLHLMYSSKRNRMELRHSPYNDRPDKIRSITRLKREDIIRLMSKIDADVFNDSDKTEFIIETPYIYLAYMETGDVDFIVVVSTPYTKKEIRELKKGEEAIASGDWFYR